MDALGKLYTSTTIVTMNVDERMNGITVAWLTRVSWDPPMVAISVGKTRYSHELLLKSHGFAVCIMGKEGRQQNTLERYREEALTSSKNSSIE